MASVLNVNITQSADGLYSATIAEFPQIAVSGANTLDLLKYGLEQAIAVIPREDGSPRGAVELPMLIPGETTWPAGTAD